MKYISGTNELPQSITTLVDELATMRGTVAVVLGGSRAFGYAVIEEAHAIMCERGEWVCNEKRLIDAARLSRTQTLFEHVPTERAALIEWISIVGEHLGMPKHETAPWMAAND